MSTRMDMQTMTALPPFPRKNFITVLPLNVENESDDIDDKYKSEGREDDTGCPNSPAKDDDWSADDFLLGFFSEHDSNSIPGSLLLARKAKVIAGVERLVSQR